MTIAPNCIVSRPDGVDAQTDFPDVGGESVDAGWIGVPGEHEASAAADECLEAPAFCAQPVQYFRRDAQKY